MPKFTITTPDGKVWDVESPDVETANKDLAAHRQELMNTQAQQEFKDASVPGKIGTAVNDVARVGADSLTFGFLDRMLGGDEAMKTKSARSRMGGADIPLDIATMGMALPTAVPKIIAKMGGGPVARTLTGTTAAGVEGGVVGGLDAAGHERDTGSGVVTGILGGAGAQQIAPLINKGWKAFRGIDDSVPAGIRSKITSLPAKGASSTDKVIVARNDAASRAKVSDDPMAVQTMTKSNIESLLRKDSKSFNKEQRAAMENVINDAPATKLSRLGGELMSDKMVASGIGIGTGALSNPLIGLAASGGILAGGRLLKEVSKGGTKEAMDDLVRLMHKKKRYPGLLSAENSGMVMKGGREGVLDLMEEW